MRNIVSLGLLGIALSVGSFVAIACSGSNSDQASNDAGTSTGDDDSGGGTTDPIMGQSDNDSGAPQGPAGTGLATGLPCDVQTILEDRCIACHDGKMQGVPALLDYMELMAKSNVDKTKSEAQEALIRMQSTTSPMPPPPAVGPDPDEIATFAQWVEAGTPENPMSCTDPPPSLDGGSIDGGMLDAGLDAGNGCTSKQYWDGGNAKSALMNPGEACLACHQKMGGPNLQFAGTVYTGAHEPDLCDGKGPPPTITVTVTDKNNKKFTGVVNAAGNFDIPRMAGGARAPFKASLSDGTKTRAMNGSVTSGDCNSCHTVAGANGAPGRIMAP